MSVKRPFLLFLRSRLFLRLTVIFAAAALIAFVILRQYASGIALLLLAAYIAAVTFLFFSRKGAEQIVRESERDTLKGIMAKIDAAAAVRDKIAVLRIGDGEMRKGIEYFLLASGSYIEKCRELKTYSPNADKRIQDVLDVCQVFLGGMDDSSTEKRYGVDDRESFPDVRQRSLDAVAQAAADIKNAVTTDLVGVSRTDTLSILEELEGKK
jgi:Ca2+/Na+ antiporter